MCIYSETLSGNQRYQVAEQPINKRFEIRPSLQPETVLLLAVAVEALDCIFEFLLNQEPRS
jgi:hypothetical protein